ncbi:hypothetical protein [Methylobacterium oryzae]|uniref:hypothetical protein n=1 Tax=Methylobacterium oryzae TaxID=334852 RepID=UPI002F35C206
MVVPGAERLGGAREPLQRRREGAGGPDAEQRQRQRQEHNGEDQRPLAGRPERIVRQRRLETHPRRRDDADMQARVRPVALEIGRGEVGDRHRPAGAVAQLPDHRQVGERLRPRRHGPVPWLDLDERQAATARQQGRPRRRVGRVQQSHQDPEAARGHARQRVGILRLVQHQERRRGDDVGHRDAGDHEQRDLARDGLRAQPRAEPAQAAHDRVTSGVNR